MSNEKKTLVADPFGLSNLDIAEAQRESEPLELDEPAPEESGPKESAPKESAIDDELKIDQIEAAVAAADEATAAEAEEAIAEWVPDPDTEARKNLALQIAEDQALEAELADEAREAEATDTELQAALPRRDEDGNLDVAEIQSCLEAILFMSDKPLSMHKLREMIGADFELSLFQEAMTALMDRYKNPSHGMEVVQVAGGYQYRTKPGRAALAKKLAKIQTQRLSGGAMETLAIVAYKQPVMKEDIDKVRGVDSSYFVRMLLDKRLISIVGRSELPGRPMLYSTTDDFLSLFGLKDLASMPGLREIEQMVPTSQSANPEDDDPRVREMRKLVGQMKADTSTSLLYDPHEDERILREIREKVSAIPTSTPSLDLQREQEKAAATNAASDVPTELPLASLVEATEKGPELG